jgi:type II secretory pathway pseudopilin PulG
MRAVIVVVALAGLLAPALATSSQAQTQRLPRRSPAEQQVDDINRSLTRKQQRLGSQQQNQIDTNQLRQDINRQRTFPSMTGPGSTRICSPGSSTC